jgi:MFS family permease
VAQETHSRKPTEGAGPSKGPRVRTFLSLRNRDYRLLWSGNLFNSGANWLQQATVGWLMWELTKSPLLVGSVAGFRALPFLVVGPFSGVLADRVDRKKLVLFSQALLALSALLFAILVAWGYPEGGQEAGESVLKKWHIFVYVTISGVAHAILQPVRSALVANTVRKEDLGNAYALQSMAVTSSRLVLPAVGGVLIATFGFKVNFFVESAMYIVLALLVIPMRTPYREQAGRGHHGSTFADLKEGVRYVWTDKPIMQLLVLSFIPNFFVQPSIHLLPVFAGAVLNRGPETFGALLSINGLAGFSATLVVASFGFILNKGLTTLVMLMVSSVGVILLGLSQWLPMTVLAVCLIGFGQTVFRTSNNTLVQTLSPDALRGRIQSIYHLDHGLTPLAGFIIALLADEFTPRWAVTGVGLASLVLSVYFVASFRRIRQLA